VFKLISLYTWPDDPPAFEQRFRSQHLPALRRLPGAHRVTISYFGDSPLGEPPYYAMTETWFRTREDLEKAAASAEAREAEAALRFARGLSTILYAQEEVLDT
jgi:uncharacterized protein (TIGR02118 family)